MKEIVKLKVDGEKGEEQEISVTLQKLKTGVANAVIERASHTDRRTGAVTTDQAKIMYLRLVNGIVEAPFKKDGKDWAVMSEEERITALKDLDEDVVTFLHYKLAKMGRMTKELENLLGTPSGEDSQKE